MGNTEAHPPEFLKRIGKISSQSAVFLAGSLFVVVAGWVYKVYVARTVGASGVGIYALGMTIVTFFGAVASFGLPTTVVRFIPLHTARGETQQIRRLLSQSVLFLLAVNAVLAIGIVGARRWIAVDFYSKPLLATYLPIFAIILVLNQMTNFLGEALRGYQEVARRTAVTTFLNFTIKIAVVVPLFLAGYQMKGYLSAELTAATVTALLLGYFVWRLTPARAQNVAHDGQSFNREALAFSVSIIGMQLLTFLSLQSDKVFVGIYLSSKDVGIYAIVSSIADYLPTSLLAVNSILGPTIAELHARKAHDLLEKIFKTVTKWTLGLTWPAAIVTMLFGSHLLRIFGGEFQAGSTALVFLVVGAIVNVGTGSVGGLLLMSGNQKWEVRAVFINAVIMIPLYLLLIPPLGIVGAAIATSAAVTAVNLTRLWFVKRLLGLFPYDRQSARIIPALLATLGVLVILKQWDASFGNLQILLLAFVLGYVTFFIVALACASADDRAMFNAVLGSVTKSLNFKRLNAGPASHSETSSGESLEVQ